MIVGGIDEAFLTTEHQLWAVKYEKAFNIISQ